MSARNATRRVGLIGLATLAVAGGQLARAAGPAAAHMGYATGTVFGASGSGNGQFEHPTGIAVDDSSGDVYVVDQGNDRVEKFDAEGKYLSRFNGSGNPGFPGGFSSPSAVAVDNSAGVSKGDVYVLDAGHNVIDKFSAAGAFVFELNGFPSAAIGVAVDPAGHLWVEESDSGVQEFDGKEKNRLTHSLAAEFGTSAGVAVDSEEDLYLLREEPNVAKLSKEGATLEGQATRCGCGTAIAVDPSTNDLFFDRGASIATYGQFGPYTSPLGAESPLETLEGISSSHGVAVDGTTHTVYASQQQADTVAVFKSVLLADVTTVAAGEVQRTSAKLEGVVDPDGDQVSACEFEYGTSTSYGQTAACEQAPGAGSSPVSVSAQVSALALATTYHYRLNATNANGVSKATDGMFTTNVAVEGLHTGEASAVQSTSATLGGALEPNGYDTHYVLEYGPCATSSECTGAPYGSTTTSTDAGSATEDKQVSVAVSGLTPNQAYHFRIVAENSIGKTNGEERLFTTTTVAPQIAGQPSASFLTAQSAVLTASLNPEHLTSSYHFEYGACPALVGCATIQSTPDETSSTYGAIGSTQEIVGLAPATTYSYRLVASNETEAGGKTLGGKATGAEGTFTTAPTAIPSAQTSTYSALTATSAVISGIVNPAGVPVTYSFELGVYEGVDTQYGVVFSGLAGSGTTAVPESLPLTGLAPGRTYAYRIAVSSGYIANESHTLLGSPATFTTGGLASILVLPAVSAQLPIPNILFPEVAASQPTTKTIRCVKGGKLSHGKCVKSKPKKKQRKHVSGRGRT